MANILRATYFKYISLFLLFFLFLYDRDMAIIYLMLMFVDYLWYVSDKKVTFHLSTPSDNILDSLTTAVIAYAAFLLINTSVKVLFFNETFSLMSGVEAMATLPILAGSLVMTWIGWVLVIPVIETSFFHGRLFEGLIDLSRKFKSIPDASLTKFTTGTMIVAAIVSIIFAIFHSKVTLAPIMTIFIFSMISCYLVIKENKLLAAVLLHIIANAAALAVKYGYL